MVEVIYYVAASLDGYIAPLDRGLSWLEPFESSEEDYGYADFYRSIDAVLVGSQTFGCGRAAVRLTSPSRAFAPRRIQSLASGTRATALSARLMQGVNWLKSKQEALPGEPTIAVLWLLSEHHVVHLLDHPWRVCFAQVSVALDPHQRLVPKHLRNLCQ